MTFEKAVELYWKAEGTKPSEFLFDGEENRWGELEAVYDAFGISILRTNNLCDDCVHRTECPFMSDDGDVCESCNFHEEVD